MKQCALLTGIAILGLLGFGARDARAASANAMTVRFNFTAVVQNPGVTVDFADKSVTTYAVTKVKFSNQDFLKLLATEFNTTFPLGAQLGMTAALDFVVLDKSGNIFLNVSSNLTDSSYVFNVTNNASNALIGKATQTSSLVTESFSYIAPDFRIYYADGKGNKFHFGGLVAFKASAVDTFSSLTYTKLSLTIPSCSGGGTFFNPNDSKYEEAVFTGIWGAAGAGLTAASPN